MKGNNMSKKKEVKLEGAAARAAKHEARADDAAKAQEKAVKAKAKADAEMKKIAIEVEKGLNELDNKLADMKKLYKASEPRHIRIAQKQIVSIRHTIERLHRHS